MSFRCEIGARATAPLDCFAESVIGPATSGRTPWLAMTVATANPVHENEFPRTGHGADWHFNHARAVAPTDGAPQGDTQLRRRVGAHSFGAETFGKGDKIRIGQ